MRKSCHTIAKTAALALAIAAGSSEATLPATADPTGNQILDRCKRAYRSLKSYRGTTRVVTKGTVAGTSSTYNTMATVQFVRPGRIRVEGTLMTSGRFAFVSDGAHTWQTSIGSPGKWELAQSTEMAIAAFTGVSQGAATTIPAILVDAMWGNPFGVVSAGKATGESVNGRTAYRVEATGPTGQATFWIDRKTFLLVKMHQRHDLSRLRGLMPKDSELPNDLPSTGVTDVTETYTGVRINEAILASAFTRPARAPQ